MTKKIIVLEGLPGVGKSTLVAALKAKQILCVDELLVDDSIEIVNGVESSQDVFLSNDIRKIEQALVSQADTVVIDRGPLSTLAYNLTKHTITKQYHFIAVASWFESKARAFYERDEVRVIYLKGHKEVPYSDSSDPYGSLENLEILETTTLNTARVFVKHLTVYEYDYSLQDAQEKLIDEILS